MKRGLVFFLALVCCLALRPDISSAQVRRAERNARQLDRQAARMINRADYYTGDTWVQVDPWVNQYNVQPFRPLERAANAVDRALFGFNDPNAQPANVWFYDYYTYWPSYYTTPDASANAYNGAIRYFDFDNDGIYESATTYRDSDHDGRFDEFDRYDFTSVKDDVQQDRSPSDAKRNTITGKIESTKTARVNNSDFLIVRVAQEGNDMLVIDLGPADAFAKLDLKVGATITATGPMERIGEKDVLMADTVVVNKQEIRIDRPAASYNGTVVDVKQIKVNDSPHTMVVVETSDGNQLVDLGPADALQVKIAPKEKIMVYGVPVRTHDHQVVMASRIDFGGKTYTVTRWK